MNVFQRVLILENSSRIGRVALAEGDKVIAERPLTQAFRHAADLPQAIRSILDELGWKCPELTAIVASLGPGSYTGLRVGIMAAKTLAYAVGCPLFGVPTFAAIARQVPADVSSVDVIADGLQRTVFVQPFRRSAPDRWESVQAIRASSLEEWKSQLAPGSAVSGPGVTIYRDALPTDCRLILGEDQNPRAQSLLREAIHGIDSNPDPWLLEPIYVRGSSAEEKRKKMG